MGGAGVPLHWKEKDLSISQSSEKSKGITFWYSSNYKITKREKIWDRGDGVTNIFEDA